MMREIRLFDAANAEISEARDWYDKESLGLGDRFVDELENVLERIAIEPGRFPYVLPGLRRALLTVFPYAVFFREKGDVIFVISCFHSSRDPKIWQRMDND